MKKNRILLVLCLILHLCFLPTFGVYAEKPLPKEIELSNRELYYMRSKKVLKVSIVSNWKPISHVTKDNTYQGLPVTILNRLSKETGISVVFVPAKSYSQSLKQLSTGKVDMIATLTEYSVPKGNDKESIQLEMIPYITTQSVLIQHKNTNLETIPVVIMADVKGRHAFTQKRNVALMYYVTPQACLNAVRSGEVDAAICDSFTGAALMQKYEARDLLSIPIHSEIKLGFGVLPQTDSRLVSTLQKAVDSFSNEDISRSLIKESAYGADDFIEFVYRYPFEFVCFGAAIMFVTALILITYTKVHVRQHQSLQGYEESYRLLADTFGEAGIEYDYLNDRLTIFGKQSSLDIEEKVDDFKERLRNQSIRMALTEAQLIKIIQDGVDNTSFSTEIQCGVKSGEWVWYRLIYTVVCTTESHRRPIRLVGCLANIEEEHAERERLLKLSSNDQLTGLLNHKTAEERISALLGEEVGSRTGLLIILDIDYFKVFNDQKGHLCGDDVLRTLGQTACEIFTEEDILCRWGGDEFLFFLVEDKNGTQKFVKQIEQLSKSMSHYQYHNDNCPVTVSIGGAQSYPGCTFAVLFQQADDALYVAKKNGKNQFQMYEEAKQKSRE
ncbi:MAG: GGDEF domain-containing protein [Lachnospiraceae bacterium]